MLGQRRRRWPNNEPTLGERPVIIGIYVTAFCKMYVQAKSQRDLSEYGLRDNTSSRRQQ